MIDVQNPNLPANAQDAGEEQGVLTLEHLELMRPDSVFASGIDDIPHPWGTAYGETVKVKWVAIRGGIHDWAIYHSFDSNITADYEAHTLAPDDLVAAWGAKIHDRDVIRDLVPCTNSALEMYRD